MDNVTLTDTLNKRNKKMEFKENRTYTLTFTEKELLEVQEFLQQQTGHDDKYMSDVLYEILHIFTMELKETPE